MTVWAVPLFSSATQGSAVARITLLKRHEMTDKQNMRRTMLAARKHHHRDNRQAADELATQFEAAHIASQTARTIALYAAAGSEIETAALMRHLSAHGHALCLPYCHASDRPAEFRAYQIGDALAADKLGVAAPQSGAIVRPDIVFLPLVAADRSGARLGRGGGTYDRTLAALREQNNDLLAIGLAYDMQLVDKCPIDPHDQYLDGLLTERRYMACHHRASNA